MDDTGKITTPADVGGTHFEFYSDQFWKDMFDDGYIIVKKVVSDFQGATYKAAILDTSLNVIVDYSQEVYSLIYNPTIEKTYLNGYLISDTYENRETICNVFDIQSNQLKKYTSAELEAFTDELIQSMNLMDYVKYGFIRKGARRCCFGAGAFQKNRGSVFEKSGHSSSRKKADCGKGRTPCRTRHFAFYR